MNGVEIVYRYERVSTVSKPERPGDAATAQRRLNDGSKAFTATFAALDAQQGNARHEIRVDPRDLGLLQEIVGAPEQRPFAAVLGCSDARVPIELIFNEGPNDLFVVRVAGNTLGSDVLASLNYALEHLGASLKLLVVLGHSGCGAVTAAVDVFLNPASYLSLGSKHAVRGLIDRLQVIVHAAAERIDGMLGPGTRSLPGYRKALIEVAVATNAAVSARTLQEEIGATNEVQAVYGVYVLSERMVWAPRCGSSEVLGLASPPLTPQDFSEFSETVIRSERIGRLLAQTTTEGAR